MKNLPYSYGKPLSFLKYFIYLSAPGLLCGTQDLPSSLGPEGFFSCSMWDLVPRPGMEPRPPVLGA